MIRRYFSKPKVQCVFYSADGIDYSNLRLLLFVTAKGREMWSSHSLAVPPSFLTPELMTRFAEVKKCFDSALAAEKAFQAECPTIEDFKKLPLAEMNSRIARRKALVAEYEAAHGNREACEHEMTTPALLHCVFLAPIPLNTPEDDTRDDNSYVLYRGAVWSGDRSFEPEQWQILIDRMIEREEAELKAALATEALGTDGRERIPAEVRRAVWIRDQGKCARCASRERLEFDHIIPVSRGGGNTERNIELLCECCNRAKSDSIE